MLEYSLVLQYFLDLFFFCSFVAPLLLDILYICTLLILCYKPILPYLKSRGKSADNNWSKVWVKGGGKAEKSCGGRQ